MGNSSSRSIAKTPSRGSCPAGQPRLRTATAVPPRLYRHGLGNQGHRWSSLRSDYVRHQQCNDGVASGLSWRGAHHCARNPDETVGPRASDGFFLLLMRTIGVRDLVLGLGTVAAGRSDDAGDVRRWTMAALASDSLDTVVSLASFRSIGKWDSWAAAALAFAFVCGDLQSRRKSTTERAFGPEMETVGAPD